MEEYIKGSWFFGKMKLRIIVIQEQSIKNQLNKYVR